jgi:hypothetical protein
MVRIAVACGCMKSQAEGCEHPSLFFVLEAAKPNRTYINLFKQLRKWCEQPKMNSEESEKASDVLHRLNCVSSCVVTGWGSFGSVGSVVVLLSMFDDG